MVARANTEGRLGNVSGAVLTGGASSRMGRDKATIEVAGVALATHLAELLGRFCVDVLLVGGRAPEGASARFVPDTHGTAPRCALRGLVSALEHARSERVLVVATDMPLLTPDLILGLTAWPEHDAVVPRRDARPEPLCAIYRREPVLAKAREKLESGDLALRSLLDAVDTSYLEGADLEVLDPSKTAFRNLNTPQDLEQTMDLLEEVRRT